MADFQGEDPNLGAGVPLVNDGQVAMRSANGGWAGTVPVGDVKKAMEAGLRFETPDEYHQRVRQQLYGDEGGGSAFLEGGARMLTFGASDYILPAAGIASKEAIEARRELHPGLNIAGQATGALTGLGAVGLAGKAGKAVGGALAGEEASAAARVIGSATEGALLGGGNVVSDMALSDHPLGAEAILSDLKSNILLGGGLGAVGGVLGEVLDKAGAEVKAYAQAAQQKSASQGAIQAKMAGGATAREAAAQTALEPLAAAGDEYASTLVDAARAQREVALPRKVTPGEVAPTERIAPQATPEAPEAGLTRPERPQAPRETVDATRPPGSGPTLGDSLPPRPPRPTAPDDVLAFREANNRLGAARDKFHQINGQLNELEPPSVGMDFNSPEEEGALSPEKQRLAGQLRKVRDAIGEKEVGPAAEEVRRLAPTPEEHARLARAVDEYNAAEKAYADWAAKHPEVLEGKLDGHTRDLIAKQHDAVAAVEEAKLPFQRPPGATVPGGGGDLGAEQAPFAQVNEPSPFFGSRDEAAGYVQQKLGAEQFPARDATPAWAKNNPGRINIDGEVAAKLGLNREAAPPAGGPPKAPLSGMGGTLDKAAGALMASEAGGLVGGLIGGPLGHAVGRMAGLVLRKHLQARVAGAAQLLSGALRVGSRAARTVGKSSSSVLRAVSYGPPPRTRMVPTGDKGTDRYMEVAAQLRALAANTPALIETSRAKLLGIQAQDQKLAQQISDGLNKRIQFLAGKLPAPSEIGSATTGILSRWRPSDAEVAKFARYVQAAEGGIGHLLAEVASGHVRPETAETAKELYPTAFNAIRERLMEQFATGKMDVPYSQRVALSNLFDAPLDSTMRPEKIAAFQQSFAIDREAKLNQLGAKSSPAPTQAQQFQQ